MRTGLPLPSLVLLPMLAASALPGASATWDEHGGGTGLTGDWDGARIILEENGTIIAARLLGEGGFPNPTDAGERQFTCFGEASLGLDLERWAGLPGASLYAEFQHRSGDDILPVSALQPWSLYAVQDRDQLGRLWYAQTLFDGLLTIKVGKEDANREFAASPYAATFMNRGLVYSATLATLPTWPDPATALNVTLAADGLYAKAGLYDGRTASGTSTGNRWLHLPCNDVFAIAEVGAEWYGLGARHLAGLALGGWRQQGDRLRADGGHQAGMQGAYVVLDRVLLAMRGKGERGLAAFVSGGLADQRVVAVARQIGGGVVWRGPFPTLPRDQAGIGGSWGGHGDAGDADEVVGELFYAAWPLPWLGLRADLQRYVHPGGLAAAAPAWVVGVRGEVLF
ncbi:MAG: carbohydrate porin [Planctomycetes bacterium]|nr:carbohydrate porin [Planctomycetota bacterium]